uniref:OTU domain-containing protein n=1 Tax=Branchiostoma floridae TaxID=7739 RepID=C3YIW8_BRAFL|eukprot:XP_002603831.1 hypothetical protein BRAFLDRAFT_101334 [Branchiostoma floridae]
MVLIIRYGTHLFGKSDHFTVDGQEAFVQTKFYHVGYMPCAPEERLASRARKQARKLQARIAKCFQRREKNVKKVVGSATCNAEETSPDKEVEDLGTVPHLAEATDPVEVEGSYTVPHIAEETSPDMEVEGTATVPHIAEETSPDMEAGCTATVPHIAEETSPDMEVEGTATVPHIAEETSPDMEVEGTATVPHIAEETSPDMEVGGSSTVPHIAEETSPDMEVEVPHIAEETSPDMEVEGTATVPHIAEATSPDMEVEGTATVPHIAEETSPDMEVGGTATVPHIVEETSPDMEVEGTATVPHIAKETSPEMEVEGTATVPHLAEAKDPNTVSHSNKVPDPNLEIEDPGQTQHPVEATDMKIVFEDPDPRMVAEDTTTEHSRCLRRSISVGQLSFRHKRKSIFKSRSDRLLLEERIASLGYERDRVPGDGNCFFWAAARQLCRGQPRVTTTAQELRQDLVKYIKSQADSYIPFLVGGAKAFWKQLDKLSAEGQWSTDLADALPHALANFTSRSVILITSKPNQPTISITPDSGNESGTPVVLSYSARWGVEHYDAVIQKNEERSDPEHGSTAI